MIELISPTYLMIKVHMKTGLKYFCRTTKDPLKYRGSGKYWLDHINKHGKEFVHNELILGPYVIKSEIEALALWMSNELDIVRSDGWANLIPENGTWGGNRGVPAKGGRAKGVPQTGKAAKGVPNTGARAKGVPATGKYAAGLKRRPQTGNAAKGIPRKNPYPKVRCPHCGKCGAPGPMKVWHFENCKEII